jgi:hypothetical protein
MKTEIIIQDYATFIKMTSHKSVKFFMKDNDSIWWDYIDKTQVKHNSIKASWLNHVLNSALDKVHMPDIELPNKWKGS